MFKIVKPKNLFLYYSLYEINELQWYKRVNSIGLNMCYQVFDAVPADFWGFVTSKTDRLVIRKTDRRTFVNQGRPDSGFLRNPLWTMKTVVWYTPRRSIITALKVWSLHKLAIMFSLGSVRQRKAEGNDSVQNQHRNRVIYRFERKDKNIYIFTSLIRQSFPKQYSQVFKMKLWNFEGLNY